jgi:DNA-binding transcriptional MerR regulator
MARIRPPRQARRTQPREPLPLRHFYRIGEVAAWLGVHVQTVREWENWFGVRPIRSSAEKQGQRVYTRQQALLLGVIRELLYTEMYTVEGAKRQLRLAREREQKEAASA